MSDSLEKPRPDESSSHGERRKVHRHPTHKEGASSVSPRKVKHGHVMIKRRRTQKEITTETTVMIDIGEDYTASHRQGWIRGIIEWFQQALEMLVNHVRRRHR